MQASRAHAGDILAILGMCEKMHEESRYARLPRDMVKVEACLRNLIKSPAGLVFTTPNGFLLGFVTDYWFSAELYAAELLLYVTPEARGGPEAAALVQAYVEGAKRLGARDVHIENSTGWEIPQVERFFASCGFTRIGGNFVMEV